MGGARAQLQRRHNAKIGTWPHRKPNPDDRIVTTLLLPPTLVPTPKPDPEPLSLILSLESSKLKPHPRPNPPR